MNRGTQKVGERFGFRSFGLRAWMTLKMSVRHFPLDIFPGRIRPLPLDISPDVFPRRKLEGRTFRFPLHCVSWHMLASKSYYSQKLSNAIYMQGRSLVKVKVNNFYILFGHIPFVGR